MRVNTSLIPLFAGFVGLSNICYTFAVKILDKVLVRRLPAEWAHRSVVVFSIVSL